MPDNKACSFNGTSESMDSSTTSGTVISGAVYSFDIANVWSVMVAAKPTSVAGTRAYFHISDIVGDIKDNDNIIEIKAIGSKVRLTIVGSTGYGTPAKVYDYNATVTGSMWFQFVATWDGSDLTLYKNGSLLSPDTKIVDETLEQTDSVDKGLILGDSFLTMRDEFQGNIHSAAVWDVKLSAAAISSLWNSGTINTIDLTTDFGSYSSSANCQHWYRLGFDSNDIGKDYGASSTLADLDNTNMNADNIVTDFPGI